MNKIIIALAVALLAIPTLISAPAEAGGKRKMHRHFHHMLTMKRHKRMREQQYDYVAAKKRKAQIIAAKKAAAKKAAAINAAQAEAAQAEVAKAEAAAPAKVADTENSSIATGGKTVAAVDTEDEATEQVASTSEVGCKRFVASVGMTLTVPCE